VQRRIDAENLGKVSYRHGFDSLLYLLGRLGNDSDGVKCDYIEWHPHSGWKATDQSMKLIRRYAPDKPIFIDDMWSNILTDVVPHDGFTQFLGADSIEGDLPNATVASIAELRDRLNAGDSAALAWYNAKGAREAVKCFATVFGEGAERVSFSLSNDFNPNHPLFVLSQAWRYTGLVGNRNTNYAPKPVTWTMRLLVDRLHDFTSVSRIDVSSNPYTRCYRFMRRRGTPCMILWSEAVPDPSDPSVPNGETVTLDVAGDTVLLTGIITRSGTTAPTVEKVAAPGRRITLRLGFEPVILEEPGSDISGVEDESGGGGESRLYPNPAGSSATIVLALKHEEVVTVRMYDLSGREVLGPIEKRCDPGEGSIDLDISGLASGTYLLHVRSGGKGRWKLLQVMHQ
jgi:hypothetical protein